MELIIKLYPDQPAHVGIKYPTVYQATKNYEGIIIEHRGENFTLQFEPLKGSVNVYLQSSQGGAPVVYKNLAYKPDHLKKLEAYVHPGNPIRFVHIYSKENVLLIAKPFKQKTFIKVGGFEIIGTQNFR